MIEFVKQYWRYLLLMVLMNLGAWYGFETTHSTDLGYQALWSIRMSLASGLLLLDTLIVLWWYADRTHQLAAMAEGQLQFQVSQWRVANKPLVFYDQDISIDQRNYRAIYYVAQNLGSGLALNVYDVQPLDDGQWSSASIGAIEAGGKRDLSAALEDPLRDHQGRMPGRILVTEAMKARTQQWIVTLNALDPEGGVHHTLVDFDPDEGISLEGVLQKHGGRFQRELATLQHEVVRGRQNRTGVPNH
jgi:hypothetical protein